MGQSKKRKLEPNKNRKPLEQNSNWRKSKSTQSEKKNRNNDELFKEKLELVNGKLELLETKEDVLLEELKNVTDRKRKLKENGENMLEKIKINNSSLEKYEASFNCNSEVDNVFSPTAMVRIECNGVLIGPLRALIDTGAHPNLAISEIGRKFKLALLPLAQKLVGIDGKPFSIRHKLNLRIRPWYETENDVYLSETFWTLPPESQWHPIMPQKILNPTAIQNPSVLPLADPEFWKPSSVQLLFGAGTIAKILISVIHRTLDGTALLESIIGVIVFGSQSDETINGERQVFSAIEYNESEQIDKLLERLWQQDQIGSSSLLSEEEIQVEKHFMETHYRDNTGRFVAKIPLRDTVASEFGSSREIALRRFMYSEKKRMKNQELNSIYVEKMRDLMRAGHLILATENPKPGELVYYIPHHIIEKDNRVVYDASCKTNKGISLNDIQMLGAKLQKDLHLTIMRFRRHKIAIYADIRKMFNQVKLSKDQWNLQRIFWREKPNEPLREYWLNVIIFGLSASPFIAVRSVIQAAREANQNYPKAAKTIEEDFYMDDCTTGANSESEAIQLAKEMDTILKGAGFELRQWKSNSKNVVKCMDSEIENTTVFSAPERTSILGIKWLIDSDKFTFVVKTPKLEGQITKRKIVSCVAELYDPNGYISPVIIIGKILIQELWKAKSEWDEKIPANLEKKWNEFWEQINYLEQFTIDRWLRTGNGAVIQIHGFSDSSESALGAVLFVRTEQSNGKVTCNLLMSKTKVAPLKTISIPRLELSAAELLARLVKEAMKSMEWEQMEYILWTDSSPTFFWIRKIPRELKTYVANRVSSIQSKTDINNWRHINGKENPADLLSRGVLPKDLVNNTLWLHGPKWLILPQSEWPLSPVMQRLSEGVEKEMKVFTVMQSRDTLRIGLKGTKTHVPFLDYVGKLEKAVNILSYVNRFIKIRLDKTYSLPQNRRSRRKEIQLSIAPPTLEEKALAMEYLLQRTQKEYYNPELSALKLGKRLPEKSRIEALNPIMDQNQLLRVGGRLNRSELDYELKHPAIVPNGSKLANLIIDFAHRQTNHGGCQVMMQFIRQNYWIPKVRSEIRNYIHKCVVCVRLNARLEGQLMAELPGERIQPGKPFFHTGVDYAGPFELKMISGKGEDVRRKCWIAIFVCLKTRAIHIDVVTDLSSIAFIACYERFIARRGRCLKMHSDNGTSFVGTNKELKRALELWTQKEMLEHLFNKGTEWRFMTPAAPHQGGIYEAAVKSMKFHLKRIVGQKVLPFEQFTTLLSQIEAILNSRPLHPLSDDP